MKKRLLITLPLLFLLTTCKKVDFNIYKVEFTSEDVVVGDTFAEITVSYTYPAELAYVKCYTSTSGDMSESLTVYQAEINNKHFVVKLTNLQANTKYYYMYMYSNGIDAIITEIKSFTTNDRITHK